MSGADVRHGAAAVSSPDIDTQYVDISSSRASGDAMMELDSEIIPTLESPSMAGILIAPSARKHLRDTSFHIKVSLHDSQRKIVAEDLASSRDDRSARINNGVDADWDVALDSSKRPVGVFSRSHFSLLISIAFAGVMASCLKRGVLPIMQNELQLQSYQADAASILVMLPWCAMFPMGFISDCIPILGTHRKFYVVFGWLLEALALFVMAIVSYAQQYNEKSDETFSPSAAMVNGHIFLLTIAYFGSVLAIVASEVYLVAISKREILTTRGQIVGTFLVFQALFECVGQVITDYVVFQVTEVGVHPLLTLHEITRLLSGLSLIPMSFVVFFFREDKSLAISAYDYQPFIARVKNHGKLAWSTLERLSMWHAVRFIGVFVFFSEFSLRYAQVVIESLCGVTAKAESTGRIVSECVGFLAIYAWRVFFLNESWRWLVALSFFVVAWLPQSIYYTMIITEVVKGVGGIYLLMESMQAFIQGILIVLVATLTIEIAPHGAEGATLGVVASVSAISRLLATTMSNAASFAFDTPEIQENGIGSAHSAGGETGQELSNAAKQRVLTALVVCYVIKLLAFSGLGFLPKQKHHLKMIHCSQAESRRYAQCTIAVLTASAVIACVFNTLVVTPTTGCLKIFGGSGCARNS